MAIASSYLVAVNRLGDMLSAIQNAQAPERFSTRFLTDLGFKTTNDRLLIAVLKSLGFLDSNGIPQQRYFDFLDKSESKRILAEGIRDAYEDLFRVKKDGHLLSKDDVKNKLKSLTQGQYSDSVLTNMAKTFCELVKYADFETPAESNGTTVKQVTEGPEIQTVTDTSNIDTSALDKDRRLQHLPSSTNQKIDGLTYRIEIILPNTRDRAVYDAIFRSLKDHLI